MPNKIYETLMQDECNIGNSPITFRRYDAGAEIAISSNPYPFVFVLQGKLECAFVSSMQQNSLVLNSGDLSVISTTQIQDYTCSDNTIIMVYEIPNKMAAVMKSTSIAFKMPCSEVIKMNEPLHKWCESLLAYYADNNIGNADFIQKSCEQLIGILLKYKREILGTLYIPMYACSLKCKECAEFTEK